MANSRRRLPPVSESTSCLVGRPDALRSQKPFTVKHTSTSLPNITKSCTSRRRRPNALFQPAKVVARRYKSAVLKWLAVNRRKYKRGKEPWPASWPMLRWHDKIRYVHFVQPLPCTLRPSEQGKQKPRMGTMPCLRHRPLKLESKGLNPFIRIGGGFRQGYIVDPAGQVDQTGRVSDKEPVGDTDASQSVDGAEINVDDTVEERTVGSKQSKWKKKQWGRNKAGERELVSFEGSDLSGVQEVFDEKQLGRVTVEKEEVESSSSNDSDANLSQGGSAVNVESDVSDQGQVRLGGRHKRNQSHQEDKKVVTSESSKMKMRKSIVGNERRGGSGGESSGDIKAGHGRRKKRGKNRLASQSRTHRGDQYRDIDVEDDDDMLERKRASPKRRRRKTKHGEKMPTQPSHSHASGEEVSDLDGQLDNCSDPDKSPSVDDDNSVQTSRKPSTVSVATEDGHEGGAVGTLKVRAGGREKQKRLSLNGVPVSEESSKNSAHNTRQADDARGSQPHQTNLIEKKKSRSGNVRKRHSGSASSNNRSDSDQANAGQISVSDSEPSVFSRDASGQLQSMDGHRRLGYLASRKRSKGTSKSSVSQPSGEGFVHTESMKGIEPTELLSDSVSNVIKEFSQTKQPEHVQHDSDSSGHAGHESPVPPSLQPIPALPENAQLPVAAATQAVPPNAVDNLLEPVSSSRKTEMKRRRSFQKVQEERGLTVEQDSSDSDGGDVLQERKKERQRRLSKKHNVPDTLKVDASDQQPSGQKSAADIPCTPQSTRRKSQPGRDSRISRDSQRKSSHEETPATLETAHAKSARSGLSARQRRKGIDYSSHLGIRSTVLDTVPSSEDVRSSPPQSSVVSSDISAVRVRPAEYLESLASKPLSNVFVHPLQTDASAVISRLPSADPADRKHSVTGVRKSAGRAHVERPPNSDEGDVDDDDDDDDDTMPCESQSSVSDGYVYQRSMPSTTVSQLTRNRAPPVEDTFGHKPAEEEVDYAPPRYCVAIDSDSGGRSTSATPSVFGAETEDMKSSILASHVGRRFSGSVSTVVSQRGLKKRQAKGSRHRSLMGSESTAPAQFVKGSTDIVVGLPPPHVATSPSSTKESEDSEETVEVIDKESRSASSCFAVSEKDSESRTPANGGKVSSMSSADRYESSDSSSQLNATTKKPVKVPSYASRNKLLSSYVEETGSLKNLLPSSVTVATVSGPSGNNGVVGLITRDITVAHMPVSTEAFRRHRRYRSSSLSGSNDELSSEGGNSGSDEDERSDAGGVAVEASEETSEQVDDDVPEAEPLPRKPWETLNRRGTQLRSRAQIQIRADEVLQRAEADSEDVKQRKRNRPVIDFLAQYHLVDRLKLRAYARAFAAEDEDEDGIISFQQLILALETIPSTSNMSRAQMDYVFRVLNLENAMITFRMFAVVVALCERISAVANEVKDILDGLDMIAVEKKLEYYMRLFLGSEDDDGDDKEVDKQKTVYCSSVKTSLLRIELKAGGLSQQMEDHVIRRCDPSGKGRVMFLDYVAYIPLFILMHERICDNPLSRERLGPADQTEDSSRSVSPAAGAHLQRIESTTLPPLNFRRGSGSSVASSYFGGSMLLKQARHLLARQISLAQSRTQIGQTQSVTSLVPDRGKTLQSSQLPQISGTDTTDSHSKAPTSGIGALLSVKQEETMKSLPPSCNSSLVGHGANRVRSNRNRPGSSSDSSQALLALRHDKNSSIRSFRIGGREKTAAERIRRITGHVTCESPESGIVSSVGDADSRPSSASVQSSRPASRETIRKAEETATDDLPSVVNDATDAVLSSERETIGPLTHPPLGRLIVPGLPASVRRLRTRSPDEMSPTPFTSSSGRTSPSNSVYSSIQASLIQGTIR